MTARPRTGLPPVVDRRTRVLILGSFPGEESLRRRQYYAHPRNQFWRLMGDLLGRDLAGLSYGQRLAALLRRGVGLWDTVRSCRRNGSLDARITAPRLNDMDAMLKGCPGVETIFLNGRAAEKFFRQIDVPSGTRALYLPSSSPAHAVSYEKKKAAWEKIVRSLPGAAARGGGRPAIGGPEKSGKRTNMGRYARG